MSHKITDRETEANQYHAMLASLGRTEEHDHRLAVHEAGHAVCARLLGQALGGATVDPGPGYGGLVWRERYVPASTEGRGDASDVRECFSPLMPKAGEDHSAYADIYGNTYIRVLELLSGRAAERMLIDGEPAWPADDLRQARELALLFCKSEEAIETFIAHCDVAARDLLMPYGDVVIALSTVLRTKRTLNGREIDKIIWDVETRKALAIEHRRRAEWRKAEVEAERFRAKCDYLNGAVATSDRSQVS
ncbi:hypothetical protein IVB02_29645 [Bradyrhizobium sp. 166]|uniref:hypothetical protein n=1 Tax=Bradyrhizobium sp. 166 TaxID=2782638 RepID=UPI001FFAD65E|nr:hypothetical protein [Bradyrhizobium sp. 166]MCK1605450.1 hypothetical protein [Bradyrhizobium sp. 166]